MPLHSFSVCWGLQPCIPHPLVILLELWEVTHSEGDAGDNNLLKLITFGKCSLWLEKCKMSQLSSERRRKMIQEPTVSSASVCHQDYGTSSPRNCPNEWRIKKWLETLCVDTMCSPLIRWIVLGIRGNQWIFLTLILARPFIVSSKPKQWDVGRRLARFLV